MTWIEGQLAHLAFDEAMAKKMARKKFQEDIKHDVYVRMSPIWERKIRVKITSVERPGPRVILPDGLEKA